MQQLIMFEQLATAHGWTITHKNAIGVFVIEKGMKTAVAYPSSNKYRFNHVVSEGLVEFVKGQL